MIDLHSHILPGLDDGAANDEQLLAMANAAVKDGITKITATPHHQNGSFTNPAAVIRKEVEKANAFLNEQNVPLEILPGQEVRIYGELLEDLEKGELLPLNDSSYLFVEFPSNQVPRYAKQMLFDVQLAGITPIIVHPERNSVFMEKPDLLYEFVQNGSLTQVTAASITGRFGKKIRSFSFDLLDANLTHFLASDAHNTTTRGFYMQEAYEEIGGETAQVLKQNAERIVNHEAVFSEQPHKIEKKGLFQKLFKK
ncbi:tyrosine-protein phosphatase [Alkalicoccus saliphilus]|uniref:Tyrosine-protein phosphatase n=1 Tax=Alkalicoccus saliphilus TaxID=200989 RepID=A0A2T4U3D4_9BACI|nr:CpsB/CapC family capsule biosynthesis tyrosine phosphatase [Alkalicoccus saliphilus]PTL37912.1 tyrosine protein phosphatase [Alkalicoccus saliphilus]